MNNDSVINKHNLMLTRRFKQIVYLSIFMLSIAIIGTLLLPDPTHTKSLLILDLFIMGALIPLITRNKIEWAKQLYLWSNLLVISYLFWERGEMFSSVALLVYPIFLMVSAVIVGSRTFIAVYLFVISLVLFISIDAISNNNNVIVSEFGYWEMVVVILMLSASGFTAWRFNGDMKYALKKLNTEVSNVKQSRSEIERLIHFDALTGLSSRLDSEKKYHLLIKEIDNEPEDIFFLYMDIDNFKSINDYYNHTAGDEVLKQVSSNFLGLIQGNEVACRLSGDEFLLILKRPNNYNIKQLSKRILRKVSEPVEIFDNHIEVTVSLGIAMRDNQIDEDFESLLKRADLAMYRAKQSGKNKSSFYDEALFLSSSRKNRIINGLKEALRNDGLELYLQPKVDIVSGEVQSAEALLRWVNNNPENISPAEFIPLIESTELICKVGEWVISRACTLCKELHDSGYKNIPVSINISSAQFVRGGLENILIRELQRSQLDPQYIELELTEHILFQDNDDVLNELTRIKDLGVKLSIDDFGTGYSNLGYLTRFKVDNLKIDQSFVKDINKSKENLAIVDAIVKMAKALSVNVIAEGVETQQEWDVLKQLGCDQGQGFLWSKPLTSNGFLKHISASV